MVGYVGEDRESVRQLIRNHVARWTYAHKTPTVASIRSLKLIQEMQGSFDLPPEYVDRVINRMKYPFIGECTRELVEQDFSPDELLVYATLCDSINRASIDAQADTEEELASRIIRNLGLEDPQEPRKVGDSLDDLPGYG